MLLPRECLCLMPAPAPVGLLAMGEGGRAEVGVSGISPGCKGTKAVRRGNDHFSILPLLSLVPRLLIAAS